MTTCELIIKPITRMVEEEKKSLDEIASTVCPKVEYGREKIIRVIKDFIREEYLIQHAESLRYDIKMSQLAKKRKSHKKIDAKVDCESPDSQSVQGSCDDATVCCGGLVFSIDARSSSSDDATVCCGGRQESPLIFSGNVFEAVRTLIEIFGLNPVQEALESILAETPKDTTEETCPDTEFRLDFDAIKIKNLSDN